ncbi:MAG: hypothetical protein ACE5KM_05660 [Planctomycetaceae bacterium]
MTDSERHAALNTLLIDLGRSLLQYSSEAWPWTAAEAQQRRAQIEELVARQSALVGRIAEFLEDRDWAVEFGAYPDYSDLHFVSIDFLLSHLAMNAEDLVTEAESTRALFTGDADGAPLLQGVVNEQRQIAAALRELCAKAGSSAA